MSATDRQGPVDPEPYGDSGNCEKNDTSCNAAVLVAEDNPINQEVARMMLEVMGCRVDQAISGIQAVEMSLKCRYDLILMDCQMPEMDGFSATKLIRERERDEYGGDAGERVTIVAMTGNTSEEDRDVCLTVGMDDFLQKPFTFEEMSAVLNRWLPMKNQAETPQIDEETLVEDDSIIDRMYLDNIRALQREGEPDLLGKVLDTYFCEAPVAIERLTEAVKSSNCAVILSVAHRFKSGSANVGALRLAEVLSELEKGAYSSTSEETHRLLEKVGNEYEAVTRVLSSIRQERKDDQSSEQRR